jgi:hypothetical protein
LIVVTPASSARRLSIASMLVVSVGPGFFAVVFAAAAVFCRHFLPHPRSVGHYIRLFVAHIKAYRTTTTVPLVHAPTCACACPYVRFLPHNNAMYQPRLGFSSSSLPRLCSASTPLPLPRVRASLPPPPLRCLCGPASQGIPLRAALPPYCTTPSSTRTELPPCGFCPRADDSTPPCLCHQNHGLVGCFLGGLALILRLRGSVPLRRPYLGHSPGGTWRLCVALSTNYDYRLPRH